MTPLPWDVLGLLGSAVGNVITDGWITIMLGLWAASLWLFGLVLGFMDATLQPDLRLEGPGRDVYMATFALAIGLALILSTVQIGVLLLRRDGRSMGRLLIGIGGFWLFLTGGISYAVAVLAAASAITRGLMESLLGVSSWRTWQVWEPFGLQDVTDAILATVMGIMSFFILIGAVGFFLIMVVRSAALLVMITTSPIAAAGLMSDVGNAWLWRLARWFHAAAFTPAVVVIVLGVGLKLTTGIAAGLSEGVASSIGTAFAATVLVCTATVAPLGLFKLLAFMDPGTASGASARAGWTAIGGLQGLIAGNRGHDGGTSAAASTSSAAGTSQGEAQAQGSTQGRVGGALSALGNLAQSPLGQAGIGVAATRLGGLPGLALGAAAALAAGSGGGTQQQQGQPQQSQGQPQQQSPLAAAVQSGRNAFAGGLGAFAGLGAEGAAMVPDLTNQAGVGHNNYYPDTGGTAARSQQGQVAHQHNAHQTANSPALQPPTPPPPTFPPLVQPPSGSSPSSHTTGDPS